MNIFKTMWAWFSFAWMPMYFDVSQDQTSDASQVTTTETQDNRMVAEGQATAIGLNRSSMTGVNITTSDHGAIDSSFKFGEGTVSRSFDFARAIASGAADEMAASGARSTALVKDAMTAVKEAYGDSSKSVKDAYQNTTEAVSAAYETAKAGEQKVMVAVGLAIVGIVAFQAMGKK